ncbi:hypothetical protein J2847_005862 [Azospirillum agricola]|uniref:hypothetical protein n=1 Tax=Azospirillum agricola TaxID=1720247 RepID=UPI001AEB327B|nr:hypothetical protein [Azospirillum agricola]MBP2232533.1 hypothetical protein [Azospirillum agricola]
MIANDFVTALIGDPEPYRINIDNSQNAASLASNSVAFEPAFCRPASRLVW